MCFSSTPVPRKPPESSVRLNLDSVVRDSSESLSLCQASIFVGDRWDTGVPRWDTVGVPLGHGVCPTGTRCVPHWGTVCAHWDTVCAPLGHGWVSHCGTVGVPLGY